MNHRWINNKVAQWNPIGRRRGRPKRSCSNEVDEAYRIEDWGKETGTVAKIRKSG